MMGSTLLLSLVALVSPAIATPAQICQYDPDSGLLNPLGMRAYITLTEESGDTTVLFEQFLSPVGGGETPVTISSTRTLTFYGIGAEEVRQLMLQNSAYYSELVGYEDLEVLPQ